MKKGFRTSDVQPRKAVGYIFVTLFLLCFLLVSGTPTMAVSTHELPADSVDRSEKSPDDTSKAVENGDDGPVLHWETDYFVASAKARERRKNLLIYFHAEEDSPSLLLESEERFISTNSKATNGSPIRQVTYISGTSQQPMPIAEACRQFCDDILSSREIAAELEQYVLVRLPLDAQDAYGNPLLEMPEFEEMLKLPGLTVIDFENDDKPYYLEVVGILPFVRAKTPTVAQMSAFLTLPPGTLTQRLLIYAVRIHPDKPRSTEGTAHDLVIQAATEQAAYQAKVNQLGHQNFGSRTNKLLAEMGGGSPSEICAQGWSGEGVFEAAIGCVRAWRASSGHWRYMKAPHTYYGYDMVKSKNNTWYATGLFVD